MPGPSKVIVLDPDPRAGRQVQFGFEREGIPTWTTPVPSDHGTIELGDDAPGLVVVGGADGRGLELVRLARKLLDDRGIDVPIVFAGKGVRRTEVEAAGADEVVLQPAYLRDLVTIGRLMRGLPSSHRGHLVGSLVETTGVYTLVRALSALGRSAVLTLIRGLRRGEVRFFHGEVTSAQVGLIHGQAALHQLLLWTDARFDFHHEDVVRRQQIPLAPDELFADAERFLEGVRDESGKLSPSMVLEQDVARVQNLGKQIPTEVHGVLRMFDGHRVLADVLEDSPYRVFETLRVTQRAVDAGLLRVVDTQRPKATWRAVLAIEEWLVGGQSRDAVIERISTDSGPVGRDTGAFEKPESGKKGSRRQRKKRRANTPLSVPIVPKVDIDWGSLVPRVVGAEVGPLSGVVPAAYASGEIDHATRDLPREGLEALMDTGKRERIFPTDVGLEPSVVFDEADEQARAALDRSKRAEAEAKERADREALAAETKDHAAAQARIRDAIARQERDREETASRATAEDVKRRAEAADWARVEAEAKAKAEAQAQAAAAKADAEVTARAQAKAKADADADAAKAQADAMAKADAEARAQADAEAKARADAALVEAKAEAKAKTDAEAEARARDEAAAAAAKTKADAEIAAKLQAAADAEAKGKADAEARKKAEAEAKAENEARAKAEVRAKREARLRAEAEAEAEEKAKRDAKAAAHARARAEAEAKAKAEAEAVKAAAEAKLAKAEAELRARADERARAEAAEQSAKLAAMRAIAETVTASEPSSASELVKQLVAAERASVPEVTITPALTVVETPMATVTVHDTVTVTSGIDSVIVSSTQTAIVTESTPAAVIDEPSDGVVHHISSADTAPIPARPIEVKDHVPASDDRPRAAGGEISQRPRRPTQEPDTSGPSILVSDIAAVQIAVSAVVTAQAAAPPSPDAASSSRDRLVAEVRKDAATFSDADEAFFRAGSEKAVKPPPPIEKFEDLDEGYQPQGFWDRLIGRKPEKPKK